ncbi:hypothetical protein Ani05nite_21880 [Amorphoplanes nipponensis]|uniref:Uncharacterized protein n=1 Tax=Actinoplanes nipponensis TaxID=135950 RepID=A0A919JKV6_9ACTN|nr:hypothetical protein Ani05nite_21880 [Actinoplanes nipponensis]
MGDVREGLLYGGLPYLAPGAGPPVVVFPGLEPDNTGPSGRSRLFGAPVHLIGRTPVPTGDRG